MLAYANDRPTPCIRVAAAAASFLLFGAPASFAQQPDQIPRELAVAHAKLFAPGFNSADPTFVVGKVPPAVAAQIPTPPGAEIIGSVVWTGITQVVGKSKADPDSVALWMSRALVAAGWRAPKTDAIMLTAGGFIPSPDTTRAAPRLCKNGEIADIKATRIVGGGSYYQVTLRFESYACRDDAYRGTTGWNGGTKLALPILYNPPDADGDVNSCISNRGSSTRTDAAFLTRLSPAALLSAYGRQLDSAGWTETATRASGSAGTWSRSDSTGATVVAELTTHTLPSAPKCRMVHLEISRLPPR